MLDTMGDARAILEQYADALSANAGASTENEKDHASDELINITGTIEEHGEEIAQLLRQLLADKVEAPPDR